MKKTKFLNKYMVPILFLVICGIGIYIARPPLAYLTGELARRMVRNTFLVLALIIPILAGMGINFGIPLGAMAGQIGLIFVTDWGVVGVKGLFLAAIIATPIAMLLGHFSGRVLNKARGREMITSMMLSFFILGIYMLFLLYLCGSIIPFRNNKIILSQGYGVKNALKLDVAKGFDDLLKFNVNIPIGTQKIAFEVPVFTIILIVLLCVFTIWFKKTKIGHDMRAVGLGQKVAANAGLNTDKIRIQSIVISTVLASYGQIIYLQNIGTLNTYAGQDQAALYAAASLLVGGASVSNASIPNAIIGTALFHLMFIVMPQAGKALTGDAMIGEYFRTFLSYGVVTVALIMHAYERQRGLEEQRRNTRLKVQKEIKAN
ncbi:ABC transporter permease subunit [Peptoniphilus stercorisuis]|uniref:Simple sugar transport system permease protein n=1 Tax=Peptoniphilus stercorisuis TaxID=1436965 RepID=A0ABS4KD05_9FIRM|nr:ABC transporter permease [Peptoniphilus stercorisuis]MBP2025642.1 simple sugar transport system permease protein [Peptoniphilus stercorisuis]